MGDTVTVIASGGDVVELPRGFTSKLGTITRFIEDMGDDINIPMEQCTKQQFGCMLEFHERFGEDAEHAAPGTGTILPSGEGNFYKTMTPKELTELMMACNYVEYLIMLDSVCIAVAMRIRGKTPNQIREMWNAPPLSEAAERELENRYPAYCAEEERASSDNAMTS